VDKLQSIKGMLFILVMGVGLGFLGEAMLCKDKIDFLKFELQSIGLVIQASNKP